MDPLIEAENVVKRYGALTAVDGISFDGPLDELLSADVPRLDEVFHRVMHESGGGR